MSDVASFIVKLIDKVTKPAKTMVGALKGVDKALKNLQHTSEFEGLDSFTDKLIDIGKKGVLVAGVLGVTVAGAITKSIGAMAVFLERARLGFKFLTGNAFDAGDAMGRAAKLATSLGLDFEFVTKNMMKMRAAQFSIGESEELIKMSSDLRAIGGDAQTVESTLRAITQIKGKGKLQAEELVQQLAESGVATTLVYKQLAMQLGKTEDEVRKLISAGKISADVGIKAIKGAIMEKVGEKELGTVGRAFAQNTAAGAIERLKGAPGLLFVRVAKQVGPAMDVVRSAIDQIRMQLTALDTSKFAAFFTGVVNLLPQAITLMGRFGDGFAEGFSSILDGFSSINIAGESQKQLWFTLGKTMAQAFGLALRFVQMLTDAVVFLQSPLGQFLIGFAAPVLLFPKFINGLSAVVKIARVFGTVWSTIGLALPSLGPLLAGVVRVFTVAIPAIVGAIGLVPLAIIAAVALAGLAIFHWWDDIKAFFKPAIAWMEDIGGKLIDAMVRGIMGALDSVGDSIASVCETIIDAVTGGLKISSPSKVMQQLGQFTSEGFALGIEGKTSRIDQAARASVAPAPAVRDGFGSAVATSAARAGDVHVTIRQITVNGGSGRPKEIGDAIAEALRSKMHGAIEAPSGG